ncbi:MAG: methyltransferase domain-containing protein [Planctomycetes bacterium]|nr:methyltransferase domain-containing protein [Planctomycetota bacterium]
MTIAWDWRVRLYDFREASCFRRGPAKAALFADMRGKVLFVAAGTGTDFAAFPPGMDITAIDISDEMLRRAAKRARAYNGTLRLLKADALALPFPDSWFDTVVTSCTMCSVPDPVRALRELNRVLCPEGRLLMFEHVRSRQFLLGWTLDLMTLWTRRTGTEMNRDTLANTRAAGFRITDIRSAYLDIILAVRAVKATAYPRRTASTRPAVLQPSTEGMALSVVNRPERHPRSPAAPEPSARV